MADWNLQATIMILVGYPICVFGTVVTGGGNTTEALIIIGFFLFTVAALLTALIKLGEVESNLIIKICCIVMLFIAGTVATTLILSQVPMKH